MLTKFLKNWFLPKRQLTRLTRDYKSLWEAHKDVLNANAELEKKTSDSNKFI